MTQTTAEKLTFGRFAQAVLDQAAREPCIGRPGSRDKARRMVLADPAAYGLTPADLPPSSNVSRREPPAAPNGRGISKRIFDACVANPTWDVCDALHHFQEENPSTVRVQYGKARRAPGMNTPARLTPVPGRG